MSPKIRFDLLHVMAAAEWKEKLDAARIRKEDMDKLVMDFFLTHGYVEAAKEFEKETGTEPNMNLDVVESRLAIRKAVQDGRVDEGIAKTNDFNPDILDSNPKLSFRLQQQHVIELIRDGKFSQALWCARENLVPYCTQPHDSFFREMERTLGLLAFENPINSPVGDLMDLKKREQAAQLIDAAILRSEGHEGESKLQSLLRLLVWAQAELGEEVDFPQIDDIASAHFDGQVV